MYSECSSHHLGEACWALSAGHWCSRKMNKLLMAQDIFEQKQRELDQQRAKKKASQLRPFDSAYDNSDDDATPKERAKRDAAQGSEHEADESAGQKHKAAANKSGLKLKLPASKNAGHRLDEAGELGKRSATWTGPIEAPSGSAGGQADAETDALGKATVLGGAASGPVQTETHRGAQAAPQQKQVKTQKDASKHASAAPQHKPVRAQRDANETAKVCCCLIQQLITAVQN